jgi:hypothetical protein
MTERVLIEGMMPYRALNRLRREGICLKKVEKPQKNRILFTVDSKDIEKIFAIYPNVCYNSGRYAPYTVRILPPSGGKKAWILLKKRIGLWLGGALFLAITLLSDTLVLRIQVSGEPAYTQAVVEILGRYGIAPYKPYSTEQLDILSAEILRLDGVGFCSLKKVGSTLVVEVQTAPFTKEK